ncbi:hypothetical protein [Xenorhabdus szentirmaii]|uniref:hypothetical protein n=1 Tax=Xenorhabdus szentirmaii TaxID=290112 RepID=UPI0019B075F2|nr:hypothetical protein [Xenorhabdus sp. CUL]MBD2793336.1 hypothetical protein [Xenorhabdus sp. CUL]
MENTDKVLAELVNKALSGFDGLNEFGQGPFPIVIEQLIRWHLWINSISFILFPELEGKWNYLTRKILMISLLK